MRKLQIGATLCCCFIALVVNAQGQTKQKPGLWEVTVQMSMAGAPQMPQLPPGTQLPPGMQMPASPFAPHTSQVCVTQAQADKYGGPPTNPPGGNCQMSNIATTPAGMTATMTCTGRMNATGTVQTTFVDANTVKTMMHMTGTMQMGSNTRPMDMTMQSTSVYKGADCGNVKPVTMPPSH
ncbi:MAG: DUF3617 domain-containing protein [Terracidiphilus sp.]|jgi:hypothetical protein